MENPPKAGTMCAVCHAPLHTDGSCPACLLRGGLPEDTLAECPHTSLDPLRSADATVYGDFEITRRDDGTLWELGRGAMGVTYRAVDRVLHRLVALKVIQLGAAPTHDKDLAEALRERFLREARAAAALRHANIAGVFHFGATHHSGRCYYAMELVEGETLEARIRRDGPLDIDTTLEIACQVAAALVAAASRGLIHRDLKPSNLMLSSQSLSARLEVKVIDFGLAKAAATADEIDLTHGGFVGTPAFASPEQFEGRPVDARTDIYSLGVTLWYALTARAPFTGRNFDELHYHPARMALPVEQLTAKKVPPAFVVLLCAMLAEDPAERPASARELLTALENFRSPAAGRGRPPPGESKPVLGRIFALSVALGVVLAGMGLTWWETRPPQLNGSVPGASGASAPFPPFILEKSVAVLPFSNLSDNQNNAYFSEGVQEEVRENLAKVADLKVISRTSVQAFGPNRTCNVREISRTLGVAYVLEGSVAREGGHLRVHTQLIDARSDTQCWAEHYDRPADDVFTIQSELAEKIATSLRARISSSEKAAIDARTTADLVAYDLYLRAKELFATYPQTNDWRAALLQCIRLLDEATARDAKFALAYCLAAQVHDSLYFTGLDATPARLALQERTITTALRLQPTLGEAHLVRALWLYHGLHDNAAAHRELSIALTALPNNALLFQTSSYMDRREGHWSKALANQARALSLDPSNYEVLNGQIDLFDMLRRYVEEAHTAELGMTNVPTSADYFRLMKAQALLEAGQVDVARSVLGALSAGFDPNGAATYTRVLAALYAGKPQEAATVLAEFRQDEYVGPGGVMTPRAWLAALVARAEGEEQQAVEELTRARESVAFKVSRNATDAFALALLGLIDAGLGRKEAALREGQEAVKIRPVAMDACDGPALLGTLSLIYAWTNEPGSAMEYLVRLQDLPAGPDYGQLRFDPAWGILRGRQDFAAMLVQMEPKPGL